jgi:hypothetical protein
MSSRIEGVMMLMDRVMNYDLSSITADLLRKADRRDFLCMNVPVCHSCGHNQEVQLIDGANQPAQWRCRVCKHFFMYEPHQHTIAPCGR